MLQKISMGQIKREGRRVVGKTRTIIFGDLEVGDIETVYVERYILSTGINCAFYIGGTKLIQPTNNDSAPCSYYGFRDLKKLKLWRCEVYILLFGSTVMSD